MTKQLAVPVSDSADHLLFGGLEQDPVALDMVMPDSQNGEYAIPLASGVPTYAPDKDPELSKKQWHNTLLPVRLQRYLTPEGGTRKRGILRPGWIYLFRDGHLWRELSVLAFGAMNMYQDVNLAAYKGKDHRPPTCPGETHILLPYRFANHSSTFEIAYSEIQWSWAQIESFGGLAKDDPRLTLPPALDHKRPKPAKSKRRAERLQQIQLKKGDLPSKHNWLNDVSENDSGNACVADAHDEQEVVITLNDPLGVLDSLMREYNALALEATVLRANVNTGEYALAKMIKAILAADQKGGSDGESLASNVDTAKIDSTIQAWDTLDKNLAVAMNKSADKVVKQLREKRTAAAFGDYFENTTTERNVLGMRRWIAAAGALESDDAHAYIRDVADGKVYGLKSIFDPDQELAVLVRQLAAGGHGQESGEGGTEFDSGKAVEFGKKGGELLEGIVTALIGAEKDNKKSESVLELVGVLVKKYTGIEVHVKFVELGTYIKYSLLKLKNVYKFEPPLVLRELAEAAKTLVPALDKVGGALEDNSFVKIGLPGLLGVLTVLNVQFALREYREKRNWKNGVALLSAIGGATEFVGEVMTKLAAFGVSYSVDADNVGTKASVAVRVSDDVLEREEGISSLLRNGDVAEVFVASSKLFRILGGAVVAGGDTVLGGWDLFAGLSTGNDMQASGGSLELAGGMIALADVFIDIPTPWTVVAGIAFGLIGGVLVLSGAEDDMTKSLKTGWFGTHCYPMFGGMFDKPDSDQYSDSDLAPGVIINVVDLTAELAELYQLLFDFSLSVSVERLAEVWISSPGNVPPQPTDVVVEVDVEFQRFQPMRSGLSLDVIVYPEDNSMLSDPVPVRISLGDMDVVERRNGDALTGIKAYVRVPGRKVVGGALGQASLDIDGSGKFRVPKDEDMKESKWDKEYGRMEMSEWGMVQMKSSWGKGVDSDAGRLNNDDINALMRLE